MATTQINGSEQIKSGTVTHTQVDSSVIVAGGGNAFSGDQSMGSHKLTNVANGVATTDAITLGQAQNLLQGLSPLIGVQAMTTGSETFTIASGSVTQISGTNVDGVTTWTIGDRILVKNAPASTGAGSADSGGAGTDQPANGVYSITGTTTNLTVVRDSTSTTPLSTGVQPSGKFVFCDEGTANKGAGYIVTDPASPDSTFTYGTTAMQWGRFNSSGSGTVTNTSVVSANGFNGSFANSSTTPALTLTTTVTGVVKGNGTAISAATAGADYMAPSNWVANETPSGTVNGSNTAFTLANTPNTNVTNPVMLYLNGNLLEPGSGNDYTISGSSITMLFAPASGDKPRAYYWK